ncbi:MAG TPA: hypothetical protein PKA77_16915 [Chitinophagaceae bacterium]|jgi:hypothetical protein|nr:hypothetical protein [Chitinophagaceae bacterium]HMU59779.1 hypothetical protein [Chitinophagaceae bacterium]
MYLKKYSNDKATVCAGKNCVTVYGEAARIITAVALTAVIIIAAAYVAKALR